MYQNLPPLREVGTTSIDRSRRPNSHPTNIVAKYRSSFWFLRTFHFRFLKFKFRNRRCIIRRALERKDLRE